MRLVAGKNKDWVFLKHLRAHVVKNVLSRLVYNIQKLKTNQLSIYSGEDK